VYIKYARREGSNNHAELIGLWNLLETTKSMDIQKMYVLGDSKLVIDWAQGKANFQNINLDLIKRDIKLAYLSFERLYIHHILREPNTKEDKLSKKSLELQIDTFVRNEFANGIDTEYVEFRF
jgi:ribonuclease HI